MLESIWVQRFGFTLFYSLVLDLRSGHWSLSFVHEKKRTKRTALAYWRKNQIQSSLWLIFTGRFQIGYKFCWFLFSLGLAISKMKRGGMGTLKKSPLRRLEVFNQISQIRIEDFEVVVKWRGCQDQEMKGLRVIPETIKEPSWVWLTAPRW